MCTVSMVGDHYKDLWKDKWWEYPSQPAVPFPSVDIPKNPTIPAQWQISVNPVTREEFDELKRQVTEMKELLRRAKIYDEKNNEPHCEVEDKMELLRKIAELVKIDLDDVLGKK